MPFEKGKEKTGGRKPGSINKLNQLAKERLAQLNCDPLEGMALIAKDKKAPIELRGRMYAELAQYVHPKLRAIEHTGKGGDKLFDVEAVRAFFSAE